MTAEINILTSLIHATYCKHTQECAGKGIQAKTITHSHYYVVNINLLVRAYVTSAESSMAEYWHTYDLEADDESQESPRKYNGLKISF